MLDSSRARRLLRLWPVMPALLVLAGCATTQTRRAGPSFVDVPPAMELHAVPFYPQEKYQCGPASLAMVLAWSGIAVRPEDLVPWVYLPGRRGSLPIDLIGAARRHGRRAYRISTLRDLVAEVADGHPVVVLQDVGPPWRRQWHFAVVVGYDLAREQVILRSGVDPRKTIAFSWFERSWAAGGSWGLLVLPPGRSPRTVIAEAERAASPASPSP